MHGIILVALRENGLVRRKSVELLADQSHDRHASLPSPSPVLPLRPSVDTDPVLVVKVVDMVDQPDDHFRVRVVPAIEELPLDVLEATDPVIPALGRPVGHIAIRLEGALVTLDEVEEDLRPSCPVMVVEVGEPESHGDG